MNRNCCLGALLILPLLAFQMATAQITQWDTIPLPRSLAYHQATDAFGNAYCIGDSTINKSTNDGMTWSRVGAYHGLAQSLLVDSTGILFVGNDALGIFRSTDSGAHWSTSLVTEGCNSLAMHPNGYLFAGLTYTGNGKVSRSTDQGTTWTSTQLPNASNSFAVEVFAFGQNGNVYAGSIDGFYRSTDLGGSWVQSNSGLQGVSVRQLLVDRDGTLYLYTTYSASVDGLYRSTNDGNSWQRISGTAPYFSAMSSAPDGNLYGASSSGIFQSTDHGVTWTSIASVLGTSQSYVSLRVTRGGRILVGGYRFFRSRGTATDVASPVETPTEFSLHQNFPNPFNPVTQISFTLSQPRHVSLSLYDVMGREVALLLNRPMTSGQHEIPFDATGLSSGTYFYRLSAGGETATRKLLLLR
jgi:photosystem II stability/assembly factor-like uncharacterized protein